MPVNKKMSIGEVLRMDGDTAALRTPARFMALTRMNLWKNSMSF